MTPVSHWHEIYQASLGLDERLARPHPGLSPDELASWCQAVARGDHWLFEARLGWDGWTAAALLQPGEPPAPPPEAFTRAMEACTAPEATGLGGHLAFAEAELARLVGPVPAALLPAREQLAAWLGALAAPVTGAAWRSLPGPAWAEHYQHYPVLARLTWQLLMQWVEQVAELWRRVEGDRPLLETRWPELGPLAQLQLGLSDRHAGGRTVARLTFQSGQELAYKPRDLGLDAAWEGFIAWFNARGPALDLHAPRTLARPGYGYAAWIAAGPCASEEELARHHQRAGMLLALAHLLRATDLHVENVIAMGEHPVLVDLETLLNPPLDLPAPEREGDPALRSLLEASVQRTMLLPTWSREATGELLDLGGLTGTLPHASNRARRGDRPVVLADHLPDLIMGFDAAHELILAARDELLAPTGPLQAFHGLTSRVLVRPTREYLALLTSSLEPGPLADGFARGALLDTLSQWRMGELLPPSWWPLVAHERRALEALDVPHLTLRTDGDELLDPPLVGVRRQSGLAAVQGMLRTWSEEDRNLQHQVIELMLGRMIPEPAGDTPAARAAGASLWAAALRVHDRPQWLQAVPREGLRVLRWLGPGLGEGTLGLAMLFGALHHTTGEQGMCEAALRTVAGLRQSLELDPAGVALAHGLSLRSGLAGMIMGLSWLGSWLGAPELLATARASAHMLTPRAVQTMDLDGSQALARQRRRLYPLVSPTVADGVAGMLLALLALHECSGDPHALELAHHAGEALLSHRVPGPSGQGWETHGLQLATGWLEGQDGIADALSRLPDMREAVAEARACAQALRAETEDVAAGPGLEHGLAWWHGQAGRAYRQLHQAHPALPSLLAGQPPGDPGVLRLY